MSSKRPSLPRPPQRQQSPEPWNLPNRLVSSSGYSSPSSVPIPLSEHPFKLRSCVLSHPEARMARLDPTSTSSLSFSISPDNPQLYGVPQLAAYGQEHAPSPLLSLIRPMPFKRLEMNSSRRSTFELRAHTLRPSFGFFLLPLASHDLSWRCGVDIFSLNDPLLNCLHRLIPLL